MAEDFNSRAHVERDTTALSDMLEGKISTHALTWSATVFVAEKSAAIAFQLTRSRGARRERKDLDVVEIDFNSRAHVERDP